MCEIVLKKSFLEISKQNQSRLKTKNPLELSGFWWCLQGSNQGHMDFQSIALPSELRHRANAGANIERFLIYPKQF